MFFCREKKNYEVGYFKGKNSITLWFHLEDIFQLMGTPEDIEHIMFELKDTPQGVEKYKVKYKTRIRFGLDII